jgi:hypothetical protein
VSDFKERTAARHAAFMADFMEVIRKHKASISIEMESGRGWEGYNGAHIEVDFECEVGEWVESMEIRWIDYKD